MKKDSSDKRKCANVSNAGRKDFSNVMKCADVSIARRQGRIPRN
jgi:hypothetical protein